MSKWTPIDFVREIRAVCSSQSFMAVVVSALGYFVDTYDLFVFSVVRVQSLEGLGISKEQTLEAGLYILDRQMIGLVLGGLLWGVLGDRLGRRRVLFGSIFLYSVANLLNAGVQSVPIYGLLRFVAGIGLAGELGAAITLVSEVLTKEKRGWGTTAVASFGFCGAVVAAIVGNSLSWRQAYFVGGMMGFVLLFMRVGLRESALFEESKETASSRGDLRMLISPPRRSLKYVACILAGVPIYFTSAILMFSSPEFARLLDVQGSMAPARALMSCYMGVVVGDLIGGALSQIFKNRKIVLNSCLLANFTAFALFFSAHAVSAEQFYWICGLLGMTTGYWTVLITLAAEQFGTNIRATVTTSVPNFVRGSAVILTTVFVLLKGSLGILHSAMAIAVVVAILALLALTQLEETYGKDLDFLEV